MGEIRDKLIAAGVKNLREFGYPQCTKDNILTDALFKAFFKGMLEDNKGKAGEAVDRVINKLLAECEDTK